MDLYGRACRKYAYVNKRRDLIGKCVRQCASHIVGSAGVGPAPRCCLSPCADSVSVGEWLFRIQASAFRGPVARVLQDVRRVESVDSLLRHPEWARRHRRRLRILSMVLHLVVASPRVARVARMVTPSLACS